MLAVLHEVVAATGSHTDNTDKYLVLMLLKLGLDATAFYLCSRKLYRYIFTMCSLSIVLADVVLTCSLAGVWFVGADRSPVPLCFLLANAAATYGVLPLPVILLGLVDYYLHNSYLCNHSNSWKYLKNAALISLGWTLALVYSLTYVNAEAKQLNRPQLKVLVSDRLSEVREKQKSHSSDLFISTDSKEQMEKCLERTYSERPPLWISLALGFGTFWIPYLMISSVCLLFDLGVPAYITVNVLWLECTNSFLMGIQMYFGKASQSLLLTQLISINFHCIVRRITLSFFANPTFLKTL
uniref:Uncharacterized protein n=1 Tax=Takifugu rubripes TaxID=31033 RepID=A0A3B5KBX9_TAKRU